MTGLRITTPGVFSYVNANGTLTAVANAGAVTYEFAGILTPTVATANPVAVLTRSDLTISGNLGNITGTTDILSLNATTNFNGVTGGPVTTMGGAQTGLYISNSAGITFNGLRAHVLHVENNSVNTVTLLKGIEPVFTNNAGTISNLRWYDVPDSSATPGGGSITNEWALYSPGTNAKVEVAGLGRFGIIDVTANTTSGVTNGFYLAGGTNLTGRCQSVDIFNLTNNAFIFKSGYRSQPRTVTAAGAVTVANTDYVILINKTVGAATTVNLPSSAGSGRTFVIKDAKGDALTNNITITPPSGLIDGAASISIITNYGKTTVVTDGTNWFSI